MTCGVRRRCRRGNQLLTFPEIPKAKREERKGLKKIMAILAAAAMILSFASCDGETAEGSGSTSVGGTSESTSAGGTSGDTSSSTESGGGSEVSGENATTEGITVTDVDGDGVIRVACVGDSITAGTEEYNYPMFLAQYLEHLGKSNGKKYEVKNFGKGGAACRHYLEDLDKDGTPEAYFYYDDPTYQGSLSYAADVVIVQMGTNDGLTGNYELTGDYYINDYTTYLVKPYQDKGAQVIVGTSPYAYTMFLSDTDNVNVGIRGMQLQIAEDLNLGVVDINKFTEGHRECFPDGIHGNAAGYHMIAQAYYKYIFGGEVVELEMTTPAGAEITLTEKTTGAQFQRVADANGKAVFGFVKDIGYSFDVYVFCEGYRPSEDKEISVSDSNVSLKVEMEEGDFVISTGAAVTSSSEATAEGRTKDKITDGDTTSDGSRWESAQSDSQPWITVDLGEVRKADAVRVYWETACAAKYTVEISTNGTDWTIIDNDAGATGKEMVRTNFGKEYDVRYLRVTCLEKINSKYNYSIYEIEVLTQNRP